jgi:transposase
VRTQREAVKLAYSIAEAAAAIGVSADTIKKAIHSTSHPLAAKRTGKNDKGEPTGKYLILHDDLVAWLDGLEAA